MGKVPPALAVTKMRGDESDSSMQIFSLIIYDYRLGLSLQIASTPKVAISM